MLSSEKPPAPNFYEREVEYFGQSPIAFIDDVTNSVNERIYQAADQLQTFLYDNCAEDISADQIEHVGVDPRAGPMISCAALIGNAAASDAARVCRGQVLYGF